jgi:uncharacterized protein YndB with AHSA1/START domain
MIKKILVAVSALILLIVIALTVLTFTTPTEFGVEREVTINRPVNEVFSYVRLLKNQNDWGPWAKKDPSMKQETKGTDGEVGFVTSWDSKNEEVGSGAQEIKKVEPNRRMETELRFEKPFSSTAQSFITTDDAGDGKTKVKWGMSGSMPRPFNLLTLVMNFDKEVGKDFDQGLASLKSILEKR